jgi:hypothetical protein
MTGLLTTVVCIVVLSEAVAGVGSARAADPKAVFVQELVAAINSKSPDRRKALLHPKSLRCATEASDSLQDEMFRRQGGRGVPANYTWTVTAIPRDQPPMFADTFDYPIRPTHLLQIDYATGPTSRTSIVLQLVYDANEWREVTACPKPETIEAAREAKRTRAKQAEKVQALVASASPSVKSTVLKLLKDGRRVEAVTYYAAETGEDITTAKGVIEQLAAQAR